LIVSFWGEKMKVLNKEYFCLYDLTAYESLHFSVSWNYITLFLICIILIIEYSAGLIRWAFATLCKFLQFDLGLQIFTRCDSSTLKSPHTNLC
jgi:hypothetical protein